MTPRCHYCVIDGNPQTLFHAFKRSEEERLVFSDRTAKCAAIIVPLVSRQTPKIICDCRAIEVVGSVQSAVPQIFKHAAMELIGPALAYHDGLTSGQQSVLRTERTGDYPILLDAIESKRSSRKVGRGTSVIVLHDRPIEHEVVRAHGGPIAAIPSSVIGSALRYIRARRNPRL